jgi:hypothetical protein
MQAIAHLPQGSLEQQVQAAAGASKQQDSKNQH